MIMDLFLFFFSSRRGLTRFSRDWSSDVCSSDLHRWLWVPAFAGTTANMWRACEACSVSSPAKTGDPVFQRQALLDRWAAAYWIEIGRASCRERVRVA